jgi:adhesin transport system outer membrane protein
MKTQSYFLPTVDVELSEVWSKNAHGDEVVDKVRSAMLVVKQNLFNGFLDTNQRVQELKKASKLNKKLDSVKRNLKEKLTISYNNFESLAQEKTHLQQYVDASSKTLKDYTSEYDLGRRSLLDMLSIHQEYNTALTTNATAKYDMTQAYYQILAYEGTLLDKLGLTLKLNAN